MLHTSPWPPEVNCWQGPVYSYLKKSIPEIYDLLKISCPALEIRSYLLGALNAAAIDRG